VNINSLLREPFYQIACNGKYTIIPCSFQSWELIQRNKGGTINPGERGKRTVRWGDKETGAWRIMDD
jgi:hypothetical protein